MRVRKHRPQFRDPTTRYVGRDELDSVLAGLDPDLVEILSAYLHGVAPSRLARRMNTAVDYGVHFLILHTLKLIRESPEAAGLREELLAEHGPRFSGTLRAVARRMEINGAPRCRYCGNLFEATAATGRPRQYCGNACRQAAYRKRLRDQTSGSGQRHGLTPPPPEHEPAPLPRKQPRHGYRVGEPGWEEYVARLLSNWRVRKPPPNRTSMYADWGAEHDQPPPMKRDTSVVLVGVGVSRHQIVDRNDQPVPQRTILAIDLDGPTTRNRGELIKIREPDFRMQPQQRIPAPCIPLAGRPPGDVPPPRRVRRSKTTCSDIPYWLRAPVWQARAKVARRHLPSPPRSIRRRMARRG